MQIRFQVNSKCGIDANTWHHVLSLLTSELCIREPRESDFNCDFKLIQVST